MSNRRDFIKVAGGMTAALVFGANLFGQAYAAEPLKVGFVYISPIGDAGWTYQHDQGRLEMEKALGAQVQTKYIENVPEGADAERVIRELASSGHKLIYATSFGYMNFVQRVAKQYPDVTFMHATGYKSAKNFGNYNARFYEGRYLNGVVAGKMSKSNVLGYVAAFPIPEVVMGINAFTLGARSVNPKAEVRVIWTNGWYDPGKEREAAMTLISQGADMLTHHTDSTAVVQSAEEKGVHAFAYHSDMGKYGATAQLSGTTHQWGDYYTQTTQAVLDGSWKSDSTWGGYRQGMIKIVPLSAAVPSEVKTLVNKLEGEMQAGSFSPFTGPITDQNGQSRAAAGQVISDAELNKMNYFVEGVASKLPQK